jgi:CysZ protein
MMINSFVKAASQLNDQNVLKYILISIIGALVVFAALWSVVSWVLTSTAIADTAWIESAVDLLGVLATGALTWLLFPAVVSAFIGLFLDGIADAVEAKHYPHLPRAKGQPIGEAIISALKFLGILVGLNLLTLPFLLVPVLFPFVFYGVNGYLLGREFFELVSLRRLDRGRAEALRKARRNSVTVAGLITAFLLTVPVVNLIAPVIATAAMVHLFHSWRAGITLEGESDDPAISDRTGPPAPTDAA